MNALTFFVDYEGFTRTINFIVQTVKANNSITQCTNAQVAAVIAGADTAIDNLNTMRTEVYSFAGFTETFPSYDDTAAVNTSVFTPTAPDVNSMRVQFSEMLTAIKQQVSLNQGMEIADSYLNTPTWTKTNTYLTAEAAAIPAIQAINDGLFV